MGRGKRKSVPALAISRDQNKVVKTKEKAHAKSQSRPSWRFSTVDINGPFAWPRNQAEEAEIVGKLHSFDSMTWADIEGKQHHFLSASSLSKEAKKRLEEIQLDDSVDNLFSFHLQGKPRIICVRQNDLALLLWHDPKHLVAPSRKKNT